MGNIMKDKIEQAKQQLGLSNAQLSVKLGYSSGYISRRLKNAPAPKTQELIKHRIDELLGESELSAVKKELEHKNQVLDKRNDLLAHAQYEIESMEKTQSSLRTVLNEVEHENKTLGISLLNRETRIKQLKKQINNERFVFIALWVIALLILVGFLGVKHGW
jgi:septal ring factor EnvC (AmiA/AmiB activator)